MGNSIEYECCRFGQDCHYYEAIHGLNGYNYKDDKFKNCNICTRPLREKMNEQGIYAKGRGETKVRGVEDK